MMDESIISSNRDEWADICKGICAILVIIVHTKKPEIYAFLFRPFFLMAFFFVGGYVSKLKSDPMKWSVSQFIKTLKIITLVEFVRILYYLIFERVSFNLIREFFCAYYQNYATYPQNTPIIWFIPCMCVAKIIFQFVLHICCGETKKVLLFTAILSCIGAFYCSIVTAFLPWHLHTAILVQLLFGMGYTYKQKESIITYDKMKLIFGISSFIYILLITRAPFAADLALLKVSSWKMYLSSALFGTIMIVSLSVLISHNCVLQYIGKNSLFFFAFQPYFIRQCYFMMERIGMKGDQDIKYITCLVVTLLTVVGLAGLIMIRDYCYKSINKVFGKDYSPLI